MKKLLGIVLFFACIGQGYGQIRVYETQEEQLFTTDLVLPGRSMPGGGDRQVITINLPENTIHWTYILQTHTCTKCKSIPSMLAEILKYTKPVSGAAGVGLQKALEYVAPDADGLSTCSADLTDAAGVAKFKEVEGLLISTWKNQDINNWGEASIKNAKKFKPFIQHPLPTKGKVYLCLKNDNLVQPVTLSITVIATVKNPKIDGTIWAVETKNWLHNYVLAQVTQGISKIIEEDPEMQEYSEVFYTEAKVLVDCGTEALFQNYQPNTIGQASGVDIERVLMPCQTAFEQKMGAMGEAEEAKEKAEEKARLLGQMGWKQYEKGNIAKCIEHSLKANETAKLDFVNANLGLCYLLQGKLEEAIGFYLESVDLVNSSEDNDYRKDFYEEIIKDINDATKIKGEIEGADTILEMLKLQMNRA